MNGISGAEFDYINVEGDVIYRFIQYLGLLIPVRTLPGLMSWWMKLRE